MLESICKNGFQDSFCCAESLGPRHEVFDVRSRMSGPDGGMASNVPLECERARLIHQKWTTFNMF